MRAMWEERSAESDDARNGWNPKRSVGKSGTRTASIASKNPNLGADNGETRSGQSAKVGTFFGGVRGETSGVELNFYNCNLHFAK